MKTFAQPGTNHIILSNGEDPRAKRLVSSERIAVQKRLRREMFGSRST